MPAEKSAYNLRDKAATTAAPYTADKAKSTPVNQSQAPASPLKGNAPASPLKANAPASPLKANAPASPTKSVHDGQSSATNNNKKVPSPTINTNKPYSPSLSNHHHRPASPTKNLRDKINLEVSHHGDTIQKIVLANHVTPKVTHSTIVAGSPTRSVPGSPTKVVASSNQAAKNSPSGTSRPLSPGKTTTAFPHGSNLVPGSPSKQSLAQINSVPGSPTKQTVGSPTKSNNTSAASTKLGVQQTAPLGKSQAPVKVSAEQIKKGLTHVGANPATPKSHSK